MLRLRVLRLEKERYLLSLPQGLLKCPAPALGGVTKWLVPDHISNHKQAPFTIHVPPKTTHVISGRGAGFAEVDFLEVWVSTLCPFSYLTQLPDVSIFSYLPFGKKRSFCYLIISGNPVVC